MLKVTQQTIQHLTWKCSHWKT